MSKLGRQTYLSDRPYFDPNRLLGESDFGVFEFSNYPKRKLLRENANDLQRRVKNSEERNARQ